MAARFGDPDTMLRVAAVIIRALDLKSSGLRFKLARTTAYLGQFESALAIDRPGAAY